MQAGSRSVIHLPEMEVIVVRLFSGPADQSPKTGHHKARECLPITEPVSGVNYCPSNNWTIGLACISDRHHFFVLPVQPPRTI